MTFKNLKVGSFVHEEFTRLQRQLSAENDSSITQNDLVHELITNYKKTRTESKRGKSTK